MNHWATITVLAVVLTAGRSELPKIPEAPNPPGDSAHLPAAVFGRVSVTARPPSPPTSLSPYARRRYQPPQQPGMPGGAEDAIVYLEPVDGTPNAARPRPGRIVQRDRTILPHVTVVQTGTTIQFPNEDDVFHNLFSLSEGNRFSLGRYSPGVTRSHRFTNPGVVRMFCDIHAEMAGVILVVSTPHVARAGEDGVYLLNELPDGTYRAIAWHPNARADTALVELRAGEERRVDFNLIAAR